MLLAGAVMGEARRCLATLSTETRRGGHGPRLQCSWEGGQAASCRCGWKSCCFPGPAADCKGARCHPWSSRSASDLHSPWQGQGDVPCGLACTACGNPEKIADDHRTNQPQRAFPIEPSSSGRAEPAALCRPAAPSEHETLRGKRRRSLPRHLRNRVLVSAHSSHSARLHLRTVIFFHGHTNAVVQGCNSQHAQPSAR